MRLFSLAVLASFLSAGSLAAVADAIPYGNPGNIAPQSTFTATATGDVTGYFYNFSAGDLDTVRMIDTTTNTVSAWQFPNWFTNIGDTADFGHANAGDNLVFELYNVYTGFTFASDPAYSDDGNNHAYATNFTAATVNGVDFPNGVYLGMEDLFYPGSDLDYNDDNYILTNVTATQAPEPGSLLLLGTGAFGVVGLLRRKMQLS